MRYDYTFMTIWELEQERAAIEAELQTRWRGFKVHVDPTMPPNEIEIVSGPHRIRVTNLG